MTGGSSSRPWRPVSGRYFADPYVVRDERGYVAFGTDPLTTSSQPFVVPTLVSDDGVSWRDGDWVLRRPHLGLGDQFWAPEVVRADGTWWMYYSVGHGDLGHRLRVAASDALRGPYADVGIDLVPDEGFAIDPHVFRCSSGNRYLFYARDVLSGERPGTHLAVRPMLTMTDVGSSVSVLEPTADWQRYESGRHRYGRRWDWHTLEGPAVLELAYGRFLLIYSGGAWTGEGYQVSWATAGHPLGPWTAAPPAAPPLLATTGDLVGPGHSSLVVEPHAGNDSWRVAFHAWDRRQEARQMHLGVLTLPTGVPLISQF